MQTILIPSQYFNLTPGISDGLISFLILLRKRGLHILIDAPLTDLPDALQAVLSLENIKVAPASDHPDIKLAFTPGKSIGEQVNDLLFPARTAVKQRKTKETDITIRVDLDKNTGAEIQTGIGFFNHMLEQISRHGNIGLSINTFGDLHIDEHHTIEDTGIALGEAIAQALGDKRGIQRYAFFLPMDDCSAKVAIDLGGRAALQYNAKFKREKIGDFPTELAEEFFRALAQGMRANIYIKAKGKNEHHKLESIFKAFAKALNEACRIDPRAGGELPSTKGLL